MSAFAEYLNEKVVLSMDNPLSALKASDMKKLAKLGILGTEPEIKVAYELSGGTLEITDKRIDSISRDEMKILLSTTGFYRAVVSLEGVVYKFYT